jgi:hypothetical protein
LSAMTMRSSAHVRPGNHNAARGAGSRKLEVT